MSSAFSSIQLTKNLNLKSMSLASVDLSLGDDAVDVGNGLVEDLLEGLGVLELLVNLGDDGVGELLLLAGLDGTLVANPRVEDDLGLVGEVDLLLELVSLSLELSGFLIERVSICDNRDSKARELVPWKRQRATW
jgi:hypothetical protein